MTGPASDPAVAIVVTCHDYGHYLESCLESVLSQTVKPAEVIVVDDGSSDATGDVLEQYAGRVRAIRTPNRGQAAAFNTGFAASCGDVVLFVDADDRLHPLAVETMVRFWSDDLAVLNFGLETIDAGGRGTGVYLPSVDADTGDNRPRLLATGTFRFPPTSGNAFSRRALSAALPMPQERWRISADCYLIRAAALFGRFAHIPRILGAYRLHGTNAYASGTAEAVPPAKHRANVRDIADALAALADAAASFADGEAEARALSQALRERAGALLAEAGKGTRGEERDWSGRNAGPGVAIARSRDREALDRLAVPRHPVHLPSGQWIEVCDESPHRGAVLPSPDGAERRLVFTVDPAVHPEVLSVRIRLEGAAEAALVAQVDGDVAFRGVVADGQTVDLPLAADPLAVRRSVSVRLAVAAQGARGRPRGRLAVDAIRVGEPADAAAHPHLEPGPPVAPAPRLLNGFPAQDWAPAGGGAARLRRAHGTLRLAVPAQTGPCDLVFALARPVPAGWLTVRADDDAFFTGTLGTAHEIAMRLPARGPRGRLDLEVGFEPREGEEEPFAIASVELRTVPAVESEGRSLAAPLDPGELANLGEPLSRARLLGPGWHVTADEEVVNERAEAVIRLSPPRHGRDLAVVLAVSPLLPPGAGGRHVVGVSVADELVTAVELAGTAEIEVPLGEAPGPELSLTLHSTLVGEGGEPSPGPLILHAVELRGRTSPPEPPRVRPAASPGGGLDWIAEAVWRHREAVEEGRTLALAGEAPRLRSELTRLIAGASAKACLLIATMPGALALFVAIREVVATRPAEPPEREAIAMAAERARSSNPLERTRAALVEILHRPPEAATWLCDLSRLPAPLLFDRPALARHLAAPPEIRDREEHRQALAFATALLTSIDGILAAEPADSALFDLAAQTLVRLRTTRLIFGPGELRDFVRLRSRCIERLLTRRGKRLGMARVPRTVTGPLRIGVLVRDVLPNPEGYALLGMYAGLDRERFEAVLIRMDRSADGLDTGDLFAEELCLSDRDVDAAVAAVRALDLDLFVEGAYVADFEKTSAIVAHRLAPVQVWSGAVCPTTSGFLSFDVALTCRATEPEAPERHYTEPLAWIEGPKQAAYAFPPVDLPPAATVRADIGVPEGALMLASGAMAHKIHDELIAAWVRILACSPNAVLVLYPFAPNWSMSFVHDTFRARLDRHCEAGGVAPERIVCLWTQPPARVRAIVAAADLYLDSFPYTGATTVCEALSSGTPVLTLAGDALRQLTGTSWVAAFGLPELVARSADDYVEAALRFCADAAWRESLRARLSQTLASGPPPHLDVERFGAAFSDALWSIAQRSGLFPGLGRASSAAARALPAGPADVVPRPLRRSSRAARAGAPPVRVALLASPRTGSTLFCNLLNRTPGIVCHYELFHEEMIQYVDRTVHDAAAIAARDADPLAFLCTVFENAGREGRTAVGFKHFDFLNDAVTRALVAAPDIRIVHLIRRNLLAQYSSEMIAQRDADWFRGTAEGAAERHEPRRIVFDEGEFEAWESYQRRVLGKRADLFAEFGRAPLFLDYASLRDPAAPARIARFLGVPVAAGGELRTAPHNTPRVIDRFANPDTVLDYLRRREREDWAGYG